MYINFVDFSSAYCGTNQYMRRRGQGELLMFDPELERTISRLHREHREAQKRNEPQGEQNGNNGRNYAPRPFIQPDDPYMLLEEFFLPPTVVHSDIRRPPIQANNFELKIVTL